MGSIPMLSPFMTENPVILAKLIARAPPASSELPRCPRKSMEMTDFECIIKVVMAVGHAIFPSSPRSSITCINYIDSFAGHMVNYQIRKKNLQKQQKEIV